MSHTSKLMMAYTEHKFYIFNDTNTLYWGGYTIEIYDAEKLAELYSNSACATPLAFVQAISDDSEFTSVIDQGDCLNFDDALDILNHFYT